MPMENKASEKVRNPYEMYHFMLFHLNKNNETVTMELYGKPDVF